MAIVEQTDATPSQREIREVNAGVYAFDRRAAVRTEPAELQQRPTGALPHRRRHLAPDGQTVHASHVDDSALVAGVTTASSWLSWPPNSTGGWWPLTSWLASPSSTRYLDRRRRHHRPRHRRVSPGYPAGPHQIGGCVVGPDTTLTDVAVGDGKFGGAYPRFVVVDWGWRAVGPFTCGPGTASWAPTASWARSSRSRTPPSAPAPVPDHVGDASTSASSNIGASSVFVNPRRYASGTAHHRRFARGRSPGPTPCSVAPVTIGDGVYTGAGSGGYFAGALAVSAGP